jgi:hypothetical protein
MTTTICIPSTTIWNLPDSTPAPDPVDKRRAEVLAWTSYQALVGYAVAICPIEARPCAPGAALPVYEAFPVAGGAPWSPSIVGGAWINCACGSRAYGCGCGLSWVELPGYVGRVDSVEVEGLALPSTAYRVDNGSRLIRQDGEGWPVQDLSKSAGSADTWVVRYFQGDAPTEIDDWAVGILAQEFLKSMSGDKKCRLPAGVQTVSRNGVTMELAQNLFLDGTTGIREVDVIIAQRNPHRLTMPPQVASPDSKRAAITTWGR